MVEDVYKQFCNKLYAQGIFSLALVNKKKNLFEIKKQYPRVKIFKFLKHYKNLKTTKMILFSSSNVEKKKK